MPMQPKPIALTSRLPSFRSCMPGLSRVLEQAHQIRGRQTRSRSRAFEDAGDERALVSVHRNDLLLDRVPRDQAVDRDRLGLADAMGAIARLVLDGRVPPGIEMEDVVGG